MTRTMYQPCIRHVRQERGNGNGNKHPFFGGEVVGFRSVYTLFAGWMYLMNIWKEHVLGPEKSGWNWPQPIDAYEGWSWSFPTSFKPPYHQFVFLQSASPQKRSGDQKPVVKFFFLHECHTHRFLFGLEKCQVFYLTSFVEAKRDFKGLRIDST